MEKDTNRNYSQQGDNPQQNKKYPGFIPDESAGNSSAEFLDEDPNHNEDFKDYALANKGPVRNPNYHDLENDTESKSSNSGSALEKKTLEDFNHTNPKRDINDNDQSEDTH